MVERLLDRLGDHLRQVRLDLRFINLDDVTWLVLVHNLSIFYHLTAPPARVRVLKPD